MKNSKAVAVIVAHPDDETLWTGGTLLTHPSWKCFVACLCRGDDKDRAPKFVKALKILNAEGAMGEIDDSPEQIPLDEKIFEETILKLLPCRHFDLIITHDTKGEYTRHLRHEETSRSVMHLWRTGQITADELWTFAYEDGHKKYYPKAIEKAPLFNLLSKDIMLEKYRIITEIYGFSPDSWEAKATPSAEAFWNQIRSEKYTS